MARKLIGCLAIVAFFLGTGQLSAQTSMVIPQTSAQRLGLTRAWFAQVERKLTHITYHSGMLLVQTDKATVHGIDAETGRTVWSTLVGSSQHPSVAPAANDKFVAAVNGSYLYVLDRNTGAVQWRKQCLGSPGAGGAMSKTHVFVPMVNGIVQAFNLLDRKEPPWLYKSSGRAWVQPLVTATTVSWTTDRGHMYVGNIEDVGIRFRLEAGSGIDSRPAYWPPYYYASSHDGYVYAVNERSGQTAWKYSTGDRIVLPPVAIDEHVFVTPDLGGMFCLNGKTGRQEWYSPGVAQFLSLSPTRVYAVDRQRQLVAIDAKTGSLQGWLSIPGVTLKLINSHSDRLYLASENGLIQCLHETGLKEPVLYTPPTTPAKEQKVTEQKGLEETTEGMPAEGGEAKPAAPAEPNPFGNDPGEKKMEEKPAEKPADNPFG